MLCIRESPVTCFWLTVLNNLTSKMILFVLPALVTIISAELMELGDYKQIMLDEHSRYRKMQGASNMQELEWDDQLAQEAGDWIKSCKFEHQHKGRGENLAFATGSNYEEMLKNAMKGWYDEINTYSYTGKACGSSCHYTQLVWAETKKVGCAMNICPWLFAFGMTVKNGWYLACFYDPAGNDMSEYPYKKGKACSECLTDQTCNDGLCAGKGKRVCEDQDDKCDYWASVNECGKNPKWMEKTCRKSCGHCEDDDIQGKEPECKDLAGEDKCKKWNFSCESNKAYMKKNCKKTCGHCS